MNNSDEASDSQPDVINEVITWEEIEKEKHILTRKEKQLDKLHKDLFPLTKEFEDIPVSKIRNSSFQKNNQFTVTAAEFLHLSSRDELNKLFDSGFSKMEIENMLESKYHEKKLFFTELGIKHHKFKRKNFSSWITLTNSHYVSTNTFMSEEELLNQLDQSQKLHLKQINNRPLMEFLEKTSSDHSNSSIPAENGILPSNKNKTINTLLHVSANAQNNCQTTGNKHHSTSNNQTPDTNENKEKEHIYEPATMGRNQSTFSNIPNFDEELVDESSTTANPTHIIPLDKESNAIIAADILSSELSKDTTNLDESTIQSSPYQDISLSNKRSFRNRTIVNRNPYLVDRAQFYGLATKNELLHMEERGMTEVEIIEYLENEFQSGRNKPIGGYKTFLELINGQKTDITTAHEDTQTFIPQASDFDTDFSLDEDDDGVYEDEGDVEIVVKDKEKDLHYVDLTLNDSIQTQKDRKGNNTMTMAKKANKTQLSKSASNSHLSHGTKTQISRSHSVKSAKKSVLKPNKLNVSTVSWENPYNMDFLTLSDDESITDPAYERGYPVLEKKMSKDAILNMPTNSSLETKSLSKNTYDTTSEIQNPGKQPSFKSSSGLYTGVLKRLRSSSKPTEKKKRRLVLDGDRNLDSDPEKASSVKRSATKGIIGGYYAPITDSSFMFNRKPRVENVQLESNTKNIALTENIPAFVPFDIQNAKDTLSNAKEVVALESIDKKLEHDTIVRKWRAIKDQKLEDRQFTFVLQLKRNDFDDFSFMDKLNISPLIQRTLSSIDFFYRKKTIKLDFMDSSIYFDIPLKSDSLSKIVAFLNLLYGSIVDKKLNKQHLKQLRKALIYVMMVISNMKQDCVYLIEKVGLELNHFLNKIKKLEVDKIIMCIICIFHIFYFIIILKSLPQLSEFYSSFKHSKRWLELKYIENFLSIPFDSVFINKKPILLSTLTLFMKSRQTDEPILSTEIDACRINVINLINLFYFMNSNTLCMQSWDIVTSILNFYGESKHYAVAKPIEIKSIFIFIHKLCCDFKWNVENDLLIKMFRILAENKFENIGSSVTPKPTLYPNSVPSIGLMVEDGCLDIYFKVLEIFSRQYMSESSKSVIERLIPVRSTFDYNDIQLQNRAKVLLMMSSIFDQDLNSGIESILIDMIRSGTVYSIRASLGLLLTLVKNSSRKPYTLIKKFLPLLVRKINKIGTNDGIINILKDLILSVIVLLDGEDVSYLNRLLDFLTIILQLHSCQNDTILNSAYGRVFTLVLKQFEFLEFAEISSKDKNRLDRKLHDVISSAKTRLTEATQFSTSMDIYIKLWVFSSSKIKQPVAQLVYSEWHYFSDIKFRTYYEVKFYEFLIQYFDYTAVLEEILIVLFKNIVTGSNDVSMLLAALSNDHIILVDTLTKSPINHNTITNNRYSITRSCLASLFKMNNEKLIDSVMNEFITTLKFEYLNFHSRDYVKETCAYIYNVTSSSKRYDFSDWDFLVEELKLDNMMHSITRKLQFIHSTDDIAIILEKSYISNILNQNLEKFKEQFTKYTLDSCSFNENIVAICTIISYHVNEIMKLNDIHWIHLEHWIKYITYYCQFQPSKVSMKNVLNLLLTLPKIKMMFASNYKYRYYYYCIIGHVYKLLDWITAMFLGFADFEKWCQSVWLFASVDINVNLKTPRIIQKANVNLERKLHHLFSSLITPEKVTVITDERQIFDLEAKLPMFQDKFVKKWGFVVDN